MSIKQYYISLEAFLEKHSFSFVKKSRDSLGSYTVYTNSIYTVKQYHMSNSYIYVNTSNGEYRSIPIFQNYLVNSLIIGIGICI